MDQFPVNRDCLTAMVADHFSNLFKSTFLLQSLNQKLKSHVHVMCKCTVVAVVVSIVQALNCSRDLSPVLVATV